MNQRLSRIAVNRRAASAILVWMLLGLCSGAIAGGELPPMASYGSTIRNQFCYTLPESLRLKLVESRSSKGAKRLVEATLTSQFGTVSDLVVCFNSSPDLRVEPLDKKIARLPQGTSTTFSCNLFAGSGKPDEMGSWIRMSVTFLPDHAAIERLAENTASYPIEIERKHLQSIVSQNKISARPFVQATRLFLKTTEEHAR